MRNETIEIVQKKEIDNLKKLIKEVFGKYNSENLDNEIDKNSVFIFGYYINDEIVGTVTLTISNLLTGKQAVVWDLAVKEEFRNQGIATKLMLKIEEKIKEFDDIDKIWLFSGKQREYAHKVYRKLGYNIDRDFAFIKEIKKNI